METLPLPVLNIHIHNRKITPQLAESGSRQDCLPIDTIFFKPFNKSMVIVHYIPGLFFAKKNWPFKGLV
jgi:hypothetical protein